MKLLCFPEHTERSCRRKLRYESAALAKVDAERMRKQGCKGIMVYRCSRCGGCHLGNSRNSRLAGVRLKPLGATCATSS